MLCTETFSGVGARVADLFSFDTRVSSQTRQTIRTLKEGENIGEKITVQKSR